MPQDYESDLSMYAVQGYILHELWDQPRTIQYFTDGSTMDEKKEYANAIRTLEADKKIFRKGNILNVWERRERHSNPLNNYGVV